MRPRQPSWMTPQGRAGAHVFVLLLALALVAHAIASYPIKLVGTVAGGTALLAIALTAGKRLWPHRHERPAVPFKANPLGVFLAVFSTASTIQVLVAQQYFGPRLTIDRATGYTVVVFLTHCIAMTGIVLAKRRDAHTLGLCIAAIYSSILYSPSFAAPEAVSPFVSLAALALALIATWPRHESTRWPGARLFYPAVLWLVLSLAACATSRAPSESWVWLRKLLVLLAFAVLVPLLARSPKHWTALAQVVILSGVGIPVLLSAAKLVDLGYTVGLRGAISYKLMLNELGRANLIARTLVASGPLLFALALTGERRWQRVLRWTSIGLALLILAACRSWGAWIAVALTGGFMAALHYGQRCAHWWRTRRSLVLRVLLPTLALASLGLILFGVLWLAPRSNIESFNGRIFHVRIALAEFTHHPWLGVGPGQHYSQSLYAEEIDWVVDTDATLDNPRRSVDLVRLYTAMHTHNLFTEIAVGSGLLGLAAFAWLLLELLHAGVQQRAGLHGPARILATGCLAGLVASLGWGVLDVMEISPPLLTFPTWALIGLLLAAPSAFEVTRPPSRARAGRPAAPSQRPIAALLWRQAPLWLAATVGILFPLLGSEHYRAAYLAYQDRHWETAATALARTERWQPLDAQARALHAMSSINQGDAARASTAYQNALEKRPGFAPYLAQLGWLYWLDGDLAQAQRHLEQAVTMDPREAWRAGVHAELGLAYIAQGRVESAIPLFQQTLQLDPQMVQASYWMRRIETNGEYKVVLDPTYWGSATGERNAQGQGALQQRIWAQLGRTDYTERLFAHDLDLQSPLSLTQVLDAMEADYDRARAAQSPEAPRLLAAAAEAAQFAGLYERAERTYRSFQGDYPSSAYGFRSLGTLYQETGRTFDARVMLETAVEKSPNDVASWTALAGLYVDQNQWAQAVHALDTLYTLDPLDADLYRLRARLYQAQGAPGKAASELSKALYVHDSVPERLALADLYRQTDPRQADKQCRRALGALLRSMPRLWDAQLDQVAGCLARAGGPEQQVATDDAPPEVRQVLLGHIYRARGQPEQALDAYQRALNSLKETDPDVGAVHYFIGETYQVLDRPDQAAAAYTIAARRAPLESLPLLALGQLQASQGRQQEALKTYQAATAVTPGCEAAHTALGNAYLAAQDGPAASQHYRLAQVASRDLDDRVVYDLITQLPEARRQTSDPAFVRNGEFTIDGIKHRVLRQHPTSQILYDVVLNHESTLSFQVALDPSSWTQVGDGVAFSVAVLPQQATPGDQPDRIWSTYIDPKQNQVDRQWRAVAIDLSAYSGQRVTLILETRPGPADDPRYDWAGWGTPRLLKRSPGTSQYSPG